ncbi:unnamed protein product [Closterium sp. Naga37s-1]|nr:unnamed protein product [Closterium sp. Naga37s-1]
MPFSFRPAACPLLPPACVDSSCSTWTAYLHDSAHTGSVPHMPPSFSPSACSCPPPPPPPSSLPLCAVWREQLFDLETAYLHDSSHTGSVLRGFDSLLAAPRAASRCFSLCSVRFFPPPPPLQLLLPPPLPLLLPPAYQIPFSFSFLFHPVPPLSPFLAPSRTLRNKPQGETQTAARTCMRSSPLVPSPVGRLVTAQPPLPSATPFLLPHACACPPSLSCPHSPVLPPSSALPPPSPPPPALPPPGLPRHACAYRIGLAAGGAGNWSFIHAVKLQAVMLTGSHADNIEPQSH